MNIAILLAAGSSSRAKQNKLWADIHGKPLWALSYETFAAHPKIDQIVLVVPRGDELRFLPFVDSEKVTVTSGGATRMESFKRGLEAAEFSDEDILLDHNAANPNVTTEEISDVIAAAQKSGAAAVSLPAVDTLLTSENGRYAVSLLRDSVRLMQTPQAVQGALLKRLNLSECTDLTSALLEHVPVAVVEASPHNKKVTFAEDIAVLQNQSFIGEDSHEFSKDGTLVLGGLEIPQLPALKANSDGDVILHAVGRALAAALNENFSELADPLMLSGDLNSRDYVVPFLEKVKIQNVTLSLECAQPKIDPLASALKESLAQILKLQPEHIRIAAHTGEGLTPFGRGEGIRCLALVTLRPC